MSDWMHSLFGESITEMKPFPGAFDNYVSHTNLRSKMDVGDTLRESLVTALYEGRLTCGVYESGTLLEMCPETVMLCVLPVNTSEDVTLNIHYTLIEAFCVENDIRLLKVDSADKLSKLCAARPPRPPPDGSSSLNNNAVSRSCLADQHDYNCVLIEYPREFSEIEEDLLEYHKITSEMYPQPVIELAD